MYFITIKGGMYLVTKEVDKITTEMGIYKTSHEAQAKLSELQDEDFDKIHGGIIGKINDIY